MAGLLERLARGRAVPCWGSLSRNHAGVQPGTGHAGQRALSAVAAGEAAAKKMAPPGTKYGLRYTVTLIPGDGVGRELCKSVKDVFLAARVPVDFEEINLSGYASDSRDLQMAIASLRKNKIGLKGTLYTPQSGPQTSFNVAIRKALDIYASVVQIHTFPGCQSRHQNVDFVVVRENTEGEYSGLEHESVDGVIESLKVTTRAKSERICKFAFDYARQNGRKKITCVHKANIMKLTDGLFLRVFNQVAAEYQHLGIATDNMIVDNAAMQLVSNPSQFDVIVTPNLYGNIVSNIGTGLIGSAGLVPGYSIGQDHAIFEPVCPPPARWSCPTEGSSTLHARNLPLVERHANVPNALFRAPATWAGTLRERTWQIPSRCSSVQSLCSAI